MHNPIHSLMIAAVLATSIVTADEVKVADVAAKYAANSTVDASKELKQSIDLGFSNTTGNTETLNINGKYTMSVTTQGSWIKPIKIGFDAAAFMTRNNDVKDNEEYTVNLGLEQSIVDEWLVYGAVSWLRNEFRNFNNKVSIGIGVGKEVYNDGQHSLKMKLGVAYNIEQYSNDQDDHKFTSLNEYLEYNNILNAVSDLYLKIGASQNINDFGDYEVLAVAGFNFSVAENLSVSIEEEVRYDKVPPVGFNTTDTKTIVRVGYNF